LKNKKLYNTIEDRKFLFNLLSSGFLVKATFTLGFFTSELASSLKTVDYLGEVTNVDLQSGYCDWKNQRGKPMPSVNINCITIIQ
jgi:hypothetical protein